MKLVRRSERSQHWRRVYHHDAGRGFAWKLFPASNRLIYASLQSEDGSYRIAKSTNGGETWARIAVNHGLINRIERVGKTLITAGASGVIRFDGVALAR